MTNRQHLRRLTIAGLALVATACTGQSAGSGPTATTTQPSFHRTTPADMTSGTSTATAPPATHYTDPIAAAKEWLVAYRSVSWTDPRPSAWIDRIRPVITDRLAGEYDQYRDGNGGADWRTFVERHCTSKVENVNGTRPAENPGTDTAAPVLVSGAVKTTCANGEPPTPSEKVAATVNVLRGPDGGWRVDQQVY
ncbi:hypothetical protein GCM10012275_57400 [Longimycelium tulufanense]|uniref:Uncharacterized protein n=1 Tax=Longimycelium tulufanense TaxID=907463 RepID=A0A8J3CJX7_9PSEU|nr:hypothetical protein [Longimycelium tulufanense]GGM79348.1 hypothetical protein GCM10012275_57400 [Longimycelium tulufanense]